MLLQLYLIYVTLHRLVISDDTVQYALQEQVAIGTRVGNVIVSSGIRKLYQKHEIQQLEFRFLAEPPIPLSIGTSDGVIRTSGVIDRDVMPWCRQSDVCEVNLDVTVQPVDYFRIIKVTISVIDINDNPPRFSETQSVLAILESASVGSTFLLPSATDADSPSFGVHRYELLTYSSKFGLKVSDYLIDLRLTYDLFFIYLIDLFYLILISCPLCLLSFVYLIYSEYFIMFTLSNLTALSNSTL